MLNSTHQDTARCSQQTVPLPGVKGKQRISQWAKSNIRMEGVQGSAKKQRWRFILISAPLPDR
ncbi:hypothetical protein HH620_004881 [Escherichia coli]|uniref:Uncharacterized protein n=2 Tax=Escherichia coli TaxID=562 RepID=A0AAX2T882_ECOLX|nr:hypothetical protein [Escherichia coli]EFN6764399.1 hypothetical protein [Escherichia coli O45:H11]EFP9271644.1 hypothetical protein [Shigella flexneri]NOV09734.1 hypothetical protein [Escherichia coli O157:H7]QJZ64295.1 hypothetical protein E3171_14365 [Escherichia coli O55:H7]QNS52974.1 hypothetical protein DXE54_11175 [Escherichia coli O145]